MSGLGRVIVGTAGHVDHGKTSLIRALTGTDCDRWAEEKQRGITIDLGFAHLLEGDLQIGFIDVPGHHRFLHNALAGLGGVRLMLLVVAADEGVMPQTREHVAICSLLGIPCGLVALSKRDLASPDILELAELEIQELLAASPFSDAPILPVSSHTGEGTGELRTRLVELAAAHRVEVDEGTPARLPVDRAFHLRGLGVVVTGTLGAGTIRLGDTLEVAPGATVVRVRSIQVHGEQRDHAAAGERTSLQLAGAELADLERGHQLVAPGCYEAVRSVCARFRLLPEAPRPLQHWQPVRLHAFSSAVAAQLRPLDPPVLEPGDEGVVEIKLASPVVLARGDRLIVRRLSPAATLGGGQVLDPAWERGRGRSAARAAAVAGDEGTAILQWIRRRGERGCRAEELARRLGVRTEEILQRLEPLRRDGRAIQVTDGQGRDRWWLAAEVYEQVSRRAEAVLDAYFERERVAAGMPRAEAVRRILPSTPPGLVVHFLDHLVRSGAIEVRGDLVARPGREVELGAAESAAAGDLVRTLELAGATPPSETELRAACGVAPAVFDLVVRYLLDGRRLIRMPGGTLIAAAAVEALHQDLLAAGWDRFAVPEFKERFGLSRKWAIPILELFDSNGWTRRIGDQRLVTRNEDKGTASSSAP